MKLVLLVACAILAVVFGETVEDQQIEQPAQNQPQAQDRVFELSRKSRQLFGTGYPYGGALSQGVYPYQVGGGVSGYSGYSGIPTTGLGFNSGQYSTALYGGGPYGGSSYGSGYGSGLYGGGAYGSGAYGSGVYGGGLYGGSQYSGGLNSGALYGATGLGLNGGYGGYSQYVNDPYSSFGTRGLIPSIPYRRVY